MAAPGNISAVRSAPLIKIKDSLLVFSFTCALPAFVHLIPASGNIPWGARLLPIFYAPLLGVLFLNPEAAVLGAIFAPAVNSMIFGMPAPAMIVPLTAELFIFTTLSGLILKRFKRFWGAAASACLLSKAAGGLISGHMVSLEQIAVILPGLSVLLLLNWLGLRWKGRTP